jgi:hypothetical protein
LCTVGGSEEKVYPVAYWSNKKYSRHVKVSMRQVIDIIKEEVMPISKIISTLMKNSSWIRAMFERERN